LALPEKSVLRLDRRLPEHLGHAILDQILDVVLVLRVVGRIGSDADVRERHLGQLVASRVVDERPTVHVDVF